jgi:hypothetical protein
VEKRRARHKALSKNPRRTQRNKEEGWMVEKALSPSARTKTNKHNPMGRARSLCVRQAHNAANADVLAEQPQQKVVDIWLISILQKFSHNLFDTINVAEWLL